MKSDEAHFLRKLLPGYYMNMVQNKHTLLPKFYGMYKYKSVLGRNIRILVMNNLLPSDVTYHECFDLKARARARALRDADLPLTARARAGLHARPRGKPKSGESRG